MSKPVLTSLCYAKPVLNIASDNTLSLFSSKQTNPACWPYRVPTRMLKKTMGFVVEHQVFLIEQKCQSRSPHKLCKVVTCLVQTVLEDPHLVNKIHTCFKLKIVNLKDEIRKFNMLAHFWGGVPLGYLPSHATRYWRVWLWLPSLYPVCCSLRRQPSCSCVTEAVTPTLTCTTPTLLRGSCPPHHLSPILFPLFF